MKLLGISDVAKRWNYSRQGVHKLIKKDGGFPKPIGQINTTVLVFELNDIEAYECDKEWLLCERSKYMRQRLFLQLHLLKDESPNEKNAALKRMFGDSARAWIQKK